MTAHAQIIFLVKSLPWLPFTGPQFSYLSHNFYICVCPIFLKFIVELSIDNILSCRCGFTNIVHRMSLLHHCPASAPLYPAQHCISIHTGARSPVGTFKPDRAFNVHTLLISSFILGHGVYETQCNCECGLPCTFLFSVHHIVTAAWREVEEDPTNKTRRPWPVRHRAQTNTFHCLHGQGQFCFI